MVDAFVNELGILDMIQHEYLVEIKGYFRSAEDSIKILMPIYDCSLTKIIQTRRPFTQQQILFLCSQILDGLAYLHDKGIMHRLDDTS